MYELWDSESRNVVRFFETAAEADDILSGTVQKSGQAILNNMFMLYEDENEDSHLVAEGEAILVAIKRLRSDELAKPNLTAMPGRRAG